VADLAAAVPASDICVTWHSLTAALAGPDDVRPELSSLRLARQPCQARALPLSDGKEQGRGRRPDSVPSWEICITPDAGLLTEPTSMQNGEVVPGENQAADRQTKSSSSTAPGWPYGCAPAAALLHEKLSAWAPASVSPFRLERITFRMPRKKGDRRVCVETSRIRICLSIWSERFATGHFGDGRAGPPSRTGQATRSSSANATPSDWKQVEAAMGRPGKYNPATYPVRLPKTGSACRARWHRDQAALP